MATTATARDQTKRIPLCPLLSLLCFVSILFVLSISRKTSPSPQPVRFNPPASTTCDYTRGSWIRDPNSRSIRYESTCREIFKGWNCISSNKSKAKDILSWRWQPQHCVLPQFDPISFLETYRDTNIGFVGDSLNGNMFVSLFCTLRRVSGDVKKWRPAGADRGFTFLGYNLTISGSMLSQSNVAFSDNKFRQY